MEGYRLLSEALTDTITQEKLKMSIRPEREMRVEKWD
jgi:hypothetical protein